MKKIKDVLKLRYIVNLSFPKIAISTGVAKSTASDYCKRFEIIKHTIEEFLLLDEDIMFAYLFPERKVKKELLIRPLPDMNYISKELGRRGVTFTLLWQEYKEANPTGYGLSQFKEHYYRYKKKLNPSMRQTHIPGENMFVDYSGMIVDVVCSKTGEISKSQIFVAVLGASGYTFVHATASQKQEDFIKSHVEAFEFYEGVPKILVPDNLKSAVISNNKKGIVLNDSYAELSRHYNCAINPARVRKPQDKSLAEQGVQAIQRWILAVFRNRVFFSVDEINQAINPLLDIYNNKIMKKINKSRTQLFEEVEKEQLLTLPANRYIYKECKVARVNIDYHVELLKCFYSVPFKYLKEKVEIKYSTTLLEIYFKSKLIATHPRLHIINETSTLKEHMPLNHQYQYEKMNPQRLLNWGTSIGINVKRFVEKRLEMYQHPSNSYKGIIAILSLAKVYGKIELDLALDYALKINATNVKSIKSILEKKLYSQAVNNTTNSVFNKHKNIRGKDYYK